MIEDFARCYAAVSGRDPRFDGWFYLGVTSTGIYCRPSCPARTPSPAKVRFFATAAAAQGGGFRACKRCRPDAAPGSPEWDARADLVGRAMRLIAEGVVDREGVSGLASRLGYSSRHVNRQLVAEVGAGPIALARAQRAHTARILVETTSLPFAQVAFAAGFSSVRQFNDTIRTVFAVPPGALRRAARARKPDTVPAGDWGSNGRAAADGWAAANGGAAADGWAAANGGVAGDGGMAAAGGSGSGNGTPGGVCDTVVLRLAHREPADLGAVFAHLAERAVAGVESAGEGRYLRSLTLPHGAGVVELAPGTKAVQAILRLEDLRDLTTAVQRCRRLLDLDADPVAVDERLGADPLLAPLVTGRPGVRVPGSADPAETAVRIVLGQQISVAAARTLARRLVELAGAPLARPVGSVTHRFPGPEALAAADLERVGMPASRRRALRVLVEALAAGHLDLSVGADRDESRRVLAALPGIGPWSVESIALRAIGDPDGFPSTDLVLRRAATALGLPATAPGLTERARAWRPWRAYAAEHLWGTAVSGTRRDAAAVAPRPRPAHREEHR